MVAVSDSPSIRSTTGAVGWSRERTRELAAAVPALAGELAARSGHVPVLRLPFAEDGRPAEGFTTSVELPLRDEAAIGLVTRLLAEAGPALLLALPALAEIVIETEAATRVLSADRADAAVTITVDGTVSRWRVAADGGVLDPALLADRPAEERDRATWSVRWAVPVEAGAAVEAGLPVEAAVAFGAGTPVGTGVMVSPVVHAPTPTDEPLGLPALLLASFPLSPDRRHVAPGPLTDFLIERAADVYAAMLPALAPGPGLLDLVPGPVGRGELDARLSRAIVSRLPDVAFLPAAEAAAAEATAAGATAARIRPRDAVLLAGGTPALADWLAPVLPGLVAGPARHPAFAVLGVRRLPLAELADLLASLDREPAWWRGLYAALAGAPAQELAELGALPVPLADGRLVRGPRGLLLPGAGLEHPGRLAVLGLRVVAPEAAHPLLVRLGAFEATPRTVLEDAATRAAVAASYDAAVEAGYDDDRPERVADAVLGLVAALDAEPGDYPYLADLALPGDDGDWYPAGELLLPDAPLAAVIAANAPFGTIAQDAVDRYGRRALEAAGLLSSFGLLTREDVELDESAIDLELDGVEDWAADARDLTSPGEPDLPPVALEVTAVRDLDLVDGERWPQALELLARPPLRAALVDRTRVRLADGRHADVPSYTAWWLRRHLVLDGHRPGDLRAPDADPLLAGLYDPIGAGRLADPVIARALGVRTSLADLLAEPGGADELLARLADPARLVSRPQLRALWAALAATDSLAEDLRFDQVRAVRGADVVLADADDALVLDAPDLWPLLADQPLVLAPYPLAARLADLLDLPLASEEIAGSLDAGSLDAAERRAVPPIVVTVLPDAPSHYLAHDKLTVDGIELPWRYLNGEIHAATPAGLGSALAWQAGQWTLRHLLTALLTDPDGADRVLADADLDPL